MDTNRLPKHALQYKPKGRRYIGRPRKRWRDKLHLEDQGTGNTPNPSGTWWWWWWWWWVTQSAMHMRNIVICNLYNSIIFFHIISQTAWFSKKKKLLNTKCALWFSLPCLSETFLILRRTEWDKKKICTGLRVKCPVFLYTFNETWIFSTDFSKNIKFHENPSSVSPAVPCRLKNRQTWQI